MGRVTGDGRIGVFLRVRARVSLTVCLLAVVHDRQDDSTPVNLELEHVLGKLPPKTFELKTIAPKLAPLVLPASATVHSSLMLVLRLLSVGSKRFLTSKV